MDNKIIDKIKKLLSLATSPNENEARAAAEKANALLIAHNLSMQQVEKQDDDYEKLTIDAGGRASIESKWIMILLTKHFFVQCIQSRKRSSYKKSTTEWLIIGEKVNTEIAHYIHGFLNNSFKSLWASYKAENDLPASSKQSYYYGLFKGIDQQLSIRRKTVETEQGLMVIPDPNLPSKVREFVGPTKSGPAIKANLSDSDARSAGEETGRKLHLRRGLESKGSDSQKYLK